MPGGMEQVYNRVVPGEHLFGNEGKAGQSLARIGETKKRDDVVVMAYCGMSTHDHPSDLAP